MATDLGHSVSVDIDAPIEDVWAAITRPDRIKAWFFGVDTRSEWRRGSEIVHTGEWQGRPYSDKGTILRIEAPRLLEHTHWSDASGVPDDPDNYEVVTWSLVERTDGTRLTVAERNLASEEARETSERIWRMVLGRLKELLEG
jgi:uncharacterized protein YndB with AHSA1/START domain